MCVWLHRLVPSFNSGPRPLMRPHWAVNWIRQTKTIDNGQDATLGTELPLNLTMKELTLFSLCVYLCLPPAPSPVTVIRKEKTSRNSVSLSWQQPERPNGIILDYEIKYYEKVGAGRITVNALPCAPLSKTASQTQIFIYSFFLGGGGGILAEFDDVW